MFKGKIRILPLLILCALISFVMRSGDFVSHLAAVAGDKKDEKSLSQGTPDSLVPNNLSIDQLAQNASGFTFLSPGAGDEDNSGDDDKADADTDSQKDSDDIAEKTQANSDDIPITEKWRDAVDSRLDNSAIGRDMALEVKAIKDRLNKREQALAQREALLKAAEKELDRKFNEMSALRDDIAKLLEEQSAEEQARIESLVKIYSGMKAKDAARIFNTLDLDIIVDIMTRMTERKTGPILAEMDSEKARSVTISLAEQNRLPELPDNL